MTTVANGGTAAAVMQQEKVSGFMQQLEADTLSILMGAESRQDKLGRELDDQMNTMETGIEDAMKQKDERLRKARLQIVEADANQLRASVAREEQDLATAMVGLKELMEQIGIDYTALTQPSPAESSIVTNAEASLKQADVDLVIAGQSWWMRNRKVSRASQVLEAAKTALEFAKAESKRLARSRLMNATLDKSLQHYIVQVGRVVDIMTRRQQTIGAQLNSVSVRRKQALVMKEKAALEMERLDSQLNEMEQKLRLAEQELEGLTNGSPEHVAKESEVSDLRNKVEGVRGDRNTALAVYNSKERFAQELQIHETTQRKLFDNQRIWIAVLKSDTQERLVTFSSRLDAMKGMSDQQVAQGMDQIGTEIDGRNAEIMANIGAASDRVRIEMFEAQPLRVQRILNALGAQAEAIAGMREREQKAIDAFRNQYGISPKAASFFTYGEKAEAAAVS